MRFLLILFAMLSGLSLADIAVATSPVHVVGAADHAAVATAPVVSECPVRARLAKAAVRLMIATPLAPGDAGFARPCGVTVADQPDE